LRPGLSSGTIFSRVDHETRRGTQRDSSLTQVNTRTVKNLVPAWAMSFGGEKQSGQESQPLVYNGKMFVTASYSRIYAIDARTGQKLWKYEHRLPEGIMPCGDVVNCGAALYDNLVIFATLDAQLVALNQDTGRLAWREKLDDYAAGYSNTAGPLIAKGLVITGVSGGEFGVVGRVEARDAKRIDLKTGRPNFIADNRPGDPTASSGGKKGKVVFAAPSFLGGKNQMPMAYSPQAGLFYVPANEWGMEIWNEPVAYKKGAAFLGAGFTIKTINDDYSGALRAIDPKSGQIVWEVKNNAPLWGGVMTNGLVFWGTHESCLKAADANTGKVLWQFQTGSGVVAPPITWTTTASSTSRSPPDGVARSRCGAATWRAR
jgi:glucose dehydrogenase